MASYTMMEGSPGWSPWTGGERPVEEGYGSQGGVSGPS